MNVAANQAVSTAGIIFYSRQLRRTVAGGLQLCARHRKPQTNPRYNGH